MIRYGNQFYLLKAVIYVFASQSYSNLTFNTEITAWGGGGGGGGGKTHF